MNCPRVAQTDAITKFGEGQRLLGLGEFAEYRGPDFVAEGLQCVHWIRWSPSPVSGSWFVDPSVVEGTPLVVAAVTQSFVAKTMLRAASNLAETVLLASLTLGYAVAGALRRLPGDL